MSLNPKDIRPQRPALPLDLDYNKSLKRSCIPYSGSQRYVLPPSWQTKIQNCTIYKRIQKGLSRHWRWSFPSPCSHFPSLTLPSSPLPPISLVTKLLIILMEMSNLLVVSIYTPEHHPLSVFCLQWKFSICFCLTSFCCVGIWSIVVRNLFYCQRPAKESHSKHRSGELLLLSSSITTTWSFASSSHFPVFFNSELKESSMYSFPPLGALLSQKQSHFGWSCSSS